MKTALVGLLITGLALAAASVYAGDDLAVNTPQEDEDIAKAGVAALR